MSTITPLQPQEDPRRRVAAEVRALLGRHDLTQAALADALDMNQSQLSKRLRGSIPFDIDEISTIARLFGVTVGSLFGEVSSPGGPRDGQTGSVSEPAPLAQLAEQLTLNQRVRGIGAKVLTLPSLSPVRAGQNEKAA